VRLLNLSLSARGEKGKGKREALIPFSFSQREEGRRQELGLSTTSRQEKGKGKGPKEARRTALDSLQVGRGKKGDGDAALPSPVAAQRGKKGER